MSPLSRENLWRPDLRDRADLDRALENEVPYGGTAGPAKVKRGTKVYVVDTEGNPAGPFRWPLVRHWFALSLLTPDAWVLIVGEQEWRSISEFPELCSWPKRTGSGDLYYGISQRKPQPSTAVQRAYLKRLGFPLPCDGFDFYLVSHHVNELAAAFPERVEPLIQNQITEQLEELTDWRREPATDDQKRYLKVLGCPAGSGLTKGEASDLIDRLADPRSDGQAP